MPASSAAEKLPDAAHPLGNPKHERVLQAFLGDPERVGWKAYVSVYPASSQGAAQTAFSRLRKNAEFAERLKYLEDAATAVAVEKSGVAIADVVNELAKIGFANMQDYLRLEGGGQPTLDWSNLSRDQAAAIASVEIDSNTIVGEAASLPADVEEELEEQPHGGALKRRRADEPVIEDVKVTKVKFKLHNKQAALVSILEHLGGFPARKLSDPDGRALGSAAADKIVDKLSDLEVARRVAFALELGTRGKDKPKR